MSSPSDTDGLIAQALAQRFGAGVVEVRKIECLDAHLHGHAFKYREGSGHLLGVYPYRIEYADEASVYLADVMVKAKPDEAGILRVYQGLLDKGGISFDRPLAELLRHSDYSVPNLKEALLFRDFAERLTPYLPESFGVYIDAATSYTLRLEKTLPAGSVVLSPDDDTTALWQPGFAELTLRGMAEIHARFLGNHEDLRQTGCFFACTTEVMLQARELWRALADFTAHSCGEVFEPGMLRRHGEIVETLADWYPLADRKPKTLLYGDMNPQNLAFAKTGGGFELSLFDWERATIHLPQRDVAEFLICTLPDDFTEQQAAEQVEIYRTALARHHAAVEGRDAFLQGMKWALYDLILNRLPLMLLVRKVAGKRRRTPVVYRAAHRLLDWLERS